MAGPLRLTDEKQFKILLLLDWFRGQDSTGVAAISKKGSVASLKVADDPIILMQHGEYESTVAGAVDAIWIGHNRASTVGASVRRNAHPFTHGHITGVHNGTLTKESLADLRKDLDEVFDTDSETIFCHISKYGIKETIKKLEGAWALVWYDEKDETLNMLKNSERPLYTCEAERKDSKERLLCWASEHSMISAARSMVESPDTLVSDAEGYAYFSLLDDTLTTWRLADLIKGVTHKQEESYLPGKPVPPKVTTWSSSNTSKLTTTTTTGSSYELQVDSQSVTDVIVTADKEEEGHYFAGAMSHEEWEVLTEHGCTYCEADVFPDTPGLAVFINERVVLCPDCSGESVTKIGGNFQQYVSQLL